MDKKEKPNKRLIELENQNKILNQQINKLLNRFAVIKTLADVNLV